MKGISIPITSTHHNYKDYNIPDLLYIKYKDVINMT